MIDRFALLRNIGQFDSVTAGAQLPLAKLTVIYGENGRGKTTVAAIIRSLATGDATPVTERHRLGATHPVHVVIDNGAVGAPAMFQHGAWSAADPSLAVYDDEFVAQNVCAGLTIENEQRQKLHELILGAQGVALNKAQNDAIEAVEEHTRDHRDHRNQAPPPHARRNDRPHPDVARRAPPLDPRHAGRPRLEPPDCPRGSRADGARRQPGRREGPRSRQDRRTGPSVARGEPYLMATPDKTDTPWAVVTRAIEELEAFPAALADQGEHAAKEAAAEAEAEVERLRLALYLFREFVIVNAKVWERGSNHHHPVWGMVADLLDGHPTHPRPNVWRFILAHNREPYEAEA